MSLVVMIYPHEAQTLIKEKIVPGPTERIPLSRSLSKVLSAPVFAPFDLPNFDNSAMDGYAIRSIETSKASPQTPAVFNVVETVAAGSIETKNLKPGEAFRIFTGAIIPKGADAVVIQENVIRTDSQISMTIPVPHGHCIRKRGEEISRDDVMFKEGTPLSSAGISWLSSFGFETTSVHCDPRVGIIVTGSEIVTPPQPLHPGQIYDSNSFALRAALEEMDLLPVWVEHIRDNKDELFTAFEKGLKQCDFLLVTGGISVGDFDFVKELLHTCGVQEIFWKLNQKPGKPLYFGEHSDQKYVFGLPGNPASALVCFYEYVRPALLCRMGHSSPFLPSLMLPIQSVFHSNTDRSQFLRGRVHFRGQESYVEVFRSQGSHLLSTFSASNCLICIPPGEVILEPGELVEVHLLPCSHFLGTHD